MVIPTGWPCDRAIEVAESENTWNVYLVEPWPYDTLMDVTFEKIVPTSSSSSEEISSSGSTGIGDKAFALPGFRTAATVYGVTGRALLSLPEGEWSSAEQVRDAIRGQLPNGVYLVRFDGVAQALKLGIRD